MDDRAIYWANRTGRTTFHRWAIRSERNMKVAIGVMGGVAALAVLAMGALCFAVVALA